MKFANLIVYGIAAMAICVASHAESPKRPQKPLTPRPMELQQNELKDNSAEIIAQHNVVTVKLLTAAKFCQAKYFEELDLIRSEIVMQRPETRYLKQDEIWW